MKKAKNLVLGFLSALMLFGAGAGIAQANVPNQTVRHNARWFANATTATARGQVNAGARATVHYVSTVTWRWNLTITGGTAIQHNGWLWSRGYVNDAAMQR